MSRKKITRKREIHNDFVYQSQLVSRFINRLMRDGKKGVAEKVFYQAIKEVAQKDKQDGKRLLDENAELMQWLGEPKSQDTGLELFRLAISKIGPEVEVKSRRVGGATYQVPMEVSDVRRRSLAIRWLVNYARERNERTMVDKLTAEIRDACRGTGGAIKKKEDVFRMAESNKAFAHYKW